MALFQRQSNAGDRIQYYTLGKNNTILLVGLGNVGIEYENTRHNVGFAAIDAFAKKNDFPAWVNKKDLKCHLTSHTLGDSRVVLIKPTTFMNLSGEAVQAVMAFYKVALENIVVVHDELDIPFGQIRMRTGGSSAGHNGLKSIIQHLGEDFGRVRVGIGPKIPEQMETSDFVLARFNTKQQAQIPDLLTEATAILSEYVFSGQKLVTETRSFLL